MSLRRFRSRSPYAVAKATAFWEVANYREAYGLFACSGILFNHDSPLRPERFVTQKIVASAFRLVGLDWREDVVSDKELCRPTENMREVSTLLMMSLRRCFRH